MKIQALLLTSTLSVVGLGMLPSTTARADQLKYVKHSQQAFAAFASLANNARNTIDIATFIFEPCHASTQVIMEILAAKSKAGVRVRLLLDEITQDDNEKKSLQAWAKKNGIELRIYNDSAIILANHRSHAKIMVVDGEAYISGGRNFADEYFGMDATANFLDRDVLVRGASAKQAARSFEEIWSARGSRGPRQKEVVFTSWAKSCGKDLSKRVASARSYLLKNSAGILKSMPQRSCGNVSFVSDNPIFISARLDGKRDKSQTSRYMSELRLRQKRVTKMLGEFIVGTRNELDMENWSYMPHESTRVQLKKLRERGVKINLVTNEDMDGPGVIKNAEEFMNNHASKRDSTGTQAVFQVSRWGSLSDRYALTPKSATFRLHGKVFVRDDRDAIVSSFNIDPRSYHTNVETAVVVKGCPSFAADVKGGIKDMVKVYARDVKSGVTKRPSEQNIFTAILGILGHNFL